MSLHVLAYNLRRLMTSLGIASMIKAVRDYVRLLVLQHVIGAIAVLARSRTPKTRRLPFGASRSRTTHISMYSSAAKA
jgi:hypothetical protein